MKNKTLGALITILSLGLGGCDASNTNPNVNAITQRPNARVHSHDAGLSFNHPDIYQRDTFDTYPNQSLADSSVDEYNDDFRSQSSDLGIGETAFDGMVTDSYAVNQSRDNLTIRRDSSVDSTIKGDSSVDSTIIGDSSQVGIELPYDNLNDGIVDKTKWLLEKDYNSEHGSSPYPGFTEIIGKGLGVHTSFSYNNDKAEVIFSTKDSSTKKPAFDFRTVKEISIDPYLSLKFRSSCFGSGSGEYFLVDEHGNEAKFYEFKATGNGDNIDDRILGLKNEKKKGWKFYLDGNFQNSVDTSALNPNDAWALKFSMKIASGSRGCYNSVYGDLWIRDLKYVK